MLVTVIRSSAQGHSEKVESILYSKTRHIFVSLEKSDSVDGLYERRFNYNLSQVYLYPDSSYIYFYVSKNRYDLSKGRYRLSNESIVFNWDSLKTCELISDSVAYSRFFKYRRPNGFRLIDNRYKIDKNQFIPIRNDHPEWGLERITLFASHRDLDSLKGTSFPYSGMGYNENGEKIYIKQPNGDKLWFRRDSLWGYALYNEAGAALYRFVNKGFNWYGSPGIQVVNITGMNLYIVGGRVNSYFSRSLDSKIHPLTLPELKKVYSDNPIFLDLLKKEIGPFTPITKSIEDSNGYLVAELYLISLEGSPMKPNCGPSLR